MPNYKVKKNDTLTKIAKENGTTVSKLMKMNPKIKDKNLIYTGATLKVYNPADPTQASGMRLANSQKPKAVAAKKVSTNNYSSVISKQQSTPKATKKAPKPATGMAKVMQGYVSKLQSPKPKAKSIAQSNQAMANVFGNYRK